MDEFSFIQAIDGFGKGIVIAVALAAKPETVHSVADTRTAKTVTGKESR